ncbi:MAG: histidine phosphatase family protein [Rubrivivax sp.]
MGTLYLVRHGQASFGQADYDRLSELGTRQCHALGAWFAGRDVRFEAVLRGTLRRHRQSLDAIADGYAAEGCGALPEALNWPGLNEYDSEALIRCIQPEPLAAPDTPEVYRSHFRLLRRAMTAWMAGETEPVGMPSWVDFGRGVSGALDHVRSHCNGDVLLVSSGGPIATAAGQVLGCDAATVVELNLRIRNSAVTEFAFNPKRHSLLAFNHLPHLDAVERRGWVSYS